MVGLQLRSPTGETGLCHDWLFSKSNEPVLIVDETTRFILRANPAAAETLRIAQTALVGTPVMQAFATSSTSAIRRSMNSARATGRAGTAMVRAAPDGKLLSAKVSFFRAGAEALLLVHLAEKAGHERLGSPQSPVFDAIEGSTVGFLMTDAALRVEYANRAFMEMAELAPVVRIQGKSLARWLELSESNMEQLRNQMLRRQATTLMTARLRSERRRLREVEVRAVAVPDEPMPCWAFTVGELPALN